MRRTAPTLLCLSLGIIISALYLSTGRRGSKVSASAPEFTPTTERVSPHNDPATGHNAGGSTTLTTAGKQLIPEVGSKLGDLENKDWVVGRVGRFFQDATIADSFSRSVDQNIEDRKTLLVLNTPEKERILIEERLNLSGDGTAEIISSHASAASTMIVGLAEVAKISSAGIDNSQVEENIELQNLITVAEDEGYQITQESQYSPVMLNFEEADSIEQVLSDREAAQSLPAIRYIEPDYIHTTQAEPNDPSYLDTTLWGMHNTGQNGGTNDVDINAPEAWGTRTSAQDVIVGVIDTGVFYNHEDLIDNMWRNPNEIPDNGIDDDGNGFVDDVYGINAIQMNGDPLDDHSHGSHCAGTIGGQGNNEIGVTGVAWDVRIMALKFLSAGGYGSSSDAITCINYARTMGAQLTSNSWGGGGYSQALFDAFKAAEEADMITVAAAGNDGSNIDGAPSYPASYELPSMVAVAAVDRNGELAWFSNYGKDTVDIAAPGVEIFSCIDEVDGYDSYQGTSMACPHAAGALAILKAEHPDEDIYHIVNRLVSGAKPLASVAEKVIAAGMIDLNRSIITSDFALKPIFLTPLIDADFLVGEDFRFDAEVIGDEPMTYQWYHDEIPIPGANSKTLIVETADSMDQGFYRLKATNEGGSRSAIAKAIAFASASEAFDITLAGSSLSWAKQIREPEGQWYLQKRITPPDGGTSLAMQSGSIGHDDSSRLMLTVNGPTRLEWQWKADCDPSGADGLNLYLNGIKERSIKSFDYAPTSWLQNWIEIPAGKHRLVFSYEKDSFIYAGNDSSWLASVSLIPSNNGTTTGQTDNDGILIEQSKSITVVEGRPTLLYTSTYIDENLGISWEHDDVSFMNERESYYIPAVSSEDSGRYELLYTRSVYTGGGVYIDEGRKIVFDLNVVPQEDASTPPVIVNQAKEIRSSQSTVILTASVESLLPVSFTWSYNGVLIDGANTSRLTLTDFDSSTKEGSYRFTVNNSAGEVTSDAIEVLYFSEGSLNPSNPLITEQPTLVILEEGSDITIPIDVAGEGPFSYQWFRENRALRGQTSNTLRLFGADSILHDGQYTLEAINAAGSVRTWPISLSVNSRGGLADAVDQDGGVWYSVGQIPWTVDYTTTTDGEDAAFILGTNMTAGESSILTTQIMGPATIRFKWNRQGAEHAELQLLKNGNYTGISITSTTGWEQQEYVLSEAGLQTIAWRFMPSFSTSQIPQSHLLAWVDDVEIIQPAPYSNLPNAILFSQQESVNTNLTIGGYADVEVLGLPDWLDFDKTDLSLRGTADGTDSYWLEIRMHRTDGTIDSEWIKLAYKGSEHNELWQKVNQSSAGGTIVGHASTPHQLTLVYEDGKIRTTQDGFQWNEQFVPKQSSHEDIRCALEIEGKLHAYSNYSNVYTTLDLENWHQGNDLISDFPFNGKIILSPEGAYALEYSDIKFSQDFTGWSEIWTDTDSFGMTNIFNYNGKLLAHNTVGTEGLYHYDNTQNNWTLSRTIPARGNIVIEEPFIYWTEYRNSKYQLLRVDSLTQTAPEVLYESTNDLDWVAVHGGLILLWDSDRYMLLTDSGEFIREAITDELSGFMSQSVRTARLGNSIFLYLDTELAKIDLENPTEISDSQSLSSIRDIVAVGEKILIAGTRENLISQDGLEFSYYESDYYNGIVAHENRFIAQNSFNLDASDDGHNWSHLMNFDSSNVGLIYTLFDENEVLLKKHRSSTHYIEYLSLDGDTWHSNSVAIENWKSPNSFAHFQGKILKTELEYNAPNRGTQLYSFEPGTGWVEMNFFEDQLLELMIFDTDDQIALIATSYHLISTDLETWQRVESPSSHWGLVYKNGQHYRISGNTVYLYSNDLDNERQYTLPLGSVSDIAITDSAIYASDDGGTVIRYRLFDENSRIAGPSYGKPGRIRTDPFLYLSPSAIDENAPLGTSLGTIGYENLEVTLPVEYELLAPGSGETLYLQLVDGNVTTSTAINFEQTPVIRTLVRATDAEGRIFEDILEVTVNDLNEAPSSLWLTSQIFTESTPLGLPLASIFSSDPDTYESFSYTLVAGNGDNDNDDFGIIDNSLILHQSFDFSERMHYSIRIRSTDSEGAFVEKSIPLYVVPETMPHAASFAIWLQVELGNPFAGNHMMNLDQDGDGLSNLFEYYLYTDPEQKDNLQVIQWQPRLSETGMDLVGYFRTNNAALSYKLEVSRDLISWDQLTLEYTNGALRSTTPDFEVLESIEEQPGLWKARIRPTNSEEQIFSRMSLIYDESRF